MDTTTAIKTRRSVRKFTDRDIPDQTLQEILEAGRWAPSPLDSQPWRFIVVKDKSTLEKLALTARHGPFLQNANKMITVVVEKNLEIDAWLKEHNQHIYSGACAMENMWLAAWALGVGCCWVSLEEQHAREVLAIPENYILIGSLVLGYPTEPARPHTDHDRKPLSATVFYERFGQAT